jgi:hypothetical protein
VYVRAFDASVTLRVAGYDDRGIWPFSTASHRTSGGRRLRRIGIVALARTLSASPVRPRAGYRESIDWNTDRILI